MRKFFTLLTILLALIVERAMAAETTRRASSLNELKRNLDAFGSFRGTDCEFYYENTHTPSGLLLYIQKGSDSIGLHIVDFLGFAVAVAYENSRYDNANAFDRDYSFGPIEKVSIRYYPGKHTIVSLSDGKKSLECAR